MGQSTRGADSELLLGTDGLPLVVILFLKSRSWVPAALAAASVELSLPLWAHRAVILKHGGYYEEMPVAVPAQFVVVALLLVAAGSPFRELERLAARRIWTARLGATGAATVGVGTCAALSSAIIGDSGTLGWAAPLVAFAGMLAVGLVASLFCDRRVASLFALPPVVAPLTVDPTLVPGHQLWSFAAPAASDGFAAWTAGAGLCVALVLHVVFETADGRGPG